MLAIASFLGIQDPRERPADQRAAADAAHAQFRDARSEFVGILRLWDAYRIAHEDMTQSQLRKWCDRNFLGFLRMREWRELHRQLKLQCDDSRGRVGLGLPPREAASVPGQAPPCRHVVLHREPSAGPPPQTRHRTALGQYQPQPPRGGHDSERTW